MLRKILKKIYNPYKIVKSVYKTHNKGYISISRLFETYYKINIHQVCSLKLRRIKIQRGKNKFKITFIYK